MSEVLDQNEIDALLASITPQPDGGAGAKREAADGARAGMSTPVSASDDEFDVDVTGYDFKRPKRVSKDQIRALGGIHDDFARSFGASLSGYLRTIVDVHVVAVEQVMYSEFIHSLPNPTCFVILQANPLEGQMFLEFSPLIVYPIIDRLLGGGGGDTLIPQRPLTSIEWRLMGRLIDRAVEHLGDAWRNLADAKFEVMETESNPHLVNIVAPTEVVVFITYEIKMGNSAATMSMCIPFNVIESVLGKLAQQSWLGYRPKAASESQQRCLLRNLRRSSVGLTAYLGQSRIKLSELRSLQVGDLIELDKTTDMPLIMQVEGRTKFAGTPGCYRGRRAIRLARAAAIDEPI
ncbi:MAG: flagellar motor switch protein FliM [Phycisphaerales bacterium]|nr:flagellar motor switch protein FliM [Phycisphaerales bacterium]